MTAHDFARQLLAGPDTLLAFTHDAGEPTVTPIRLPFNDGGRMDALLVEPAEGVGDDFVASDFKRIDAQLDDQRDIAEMAGAELIRLQAELARVEAERDRLVGLFVRPDHDDDDLGPKWILDSERASIGHRGFFPTRQKAVAELWIMLDDIEPEGS